MKVNGLLFYGPHWCRFKSDLKVRHRVFVRTLPNIGLVTWSRFRAMKLCCVYTTGKNVQSSCFCLTRLALRKFFLYYLSSITTVHLMLPCIFKFWLLMCILRYGLFLCILKLATSAILAFLTKRTRFNSVLIRACMLNACVLEKGK